MRVISVGKVSKLLSQSCNGTVPWWVASLFFGVFWPYPVMLTLVAVGLSVMAWRGPFYLDSLSAWSMLAFLWTFGVGGVVFAAWMTTKPWSETRKDRRRMLATALFAGMVFWGGMYALTFLTLPPNGR